MKHDNEQYGQKIFKDKPMIKHGLDSEQLL
jgi:hypothetical protein